MKTISSKDLSKLTNLNKVKSSLLSQGNDDEWWHNGFGYEDENGNYHWHAGYSLDTFEKWEGYWPGGWVEILGYVLPDVIVYGYYTGYNNEWENNSPWQNTEINNSFYFYYGSGIRPITPSTSGGGGGGNYEISYPEAFLYGKIEPQFNRIIQQLKSNISNIVAELSEKIYNIYTSLKDFVVQKPWLKTEIKEYTLDMSDYVSNNIIENNINKMTWRDLFMVWLFEIPNANTINYHTDEDGNTIERDMYMFTADAFTTKDLMQQEGVIEAREEAYRRIRNGIFNDEFSHIWTYDVNEFFDGIIQLNEATSFLGSYTININYKDNNNGSFTLYFSVTNTTGWESGTRLRVDHDGDGVHDGIIEDIERCDNRGLGLGGTIDEEWIWTEVYWP